MSCFGAPGEGCGEGCGNNGGALPGSMATSGGLLGMVYTETQRWPMQAEFGQIWTGLD